MRRVIAVLFLIGVTGCGAAHVRPQAHTTHALASGAYIGRVTVTSQETSVATNVALQNKLKKWESMARERLHQGLISRGYQVAESEPDASSTVLVWNLDIDVRYGNQSLRYLVGFGAGKGHIRSTLVVEDPAQGEIYRTGADSDMSIGAFGGDMDKVFRSNIKKLVGALPAPQP